MAEKPEHSRPIEHDEFIQLCEVLLSMIDPESYVRTDPVDRKVADKASKYRSLFYEQIRDIIKEDVDQQRKRRSSWT
eukprot:6461877-Amphidinium_carterae.1